ncbi:MAG TPA: DNA-processing protein DprA [Gammaproteobacteria bacterium]|nr:DNA-processing protein DprA [Gammaproteobacteria bacterium]
MRSPPQAQIRPIARHRRLAQRIVEHGAIISKFPTGASPKLEHFPRRNRLISGLSLGVWCWRPHAAPVH